MNVLTSQWWPQCPWKTIIGIVLHCITHICYIVLNTCGTLHYTDIAVSYCCFHFVEAWCSGSCLSFFHHQFTLRPPEALSFSWVMWACSPLQSRCSDHNSFSMRGFWLVKKLCSVLEDGVRLGSSINQAVLKYRGVSRAVEPAGLGFVLYKLLHVQKEPGSSIIRYEREGDMITWVSRQVQFIR